MERLLRLLIIEDNADDAELMIHSLERCGFEPKWTRVDTAGALKAALAAQTWDAVLSDFTLPNFGAAAALDIVRAADRTIPFLVVSGTVGEERAVETMRAGANDYVLKDNLTRLGPALNRELCEADNRRARKRSDEAMRASETRYRRLFEAAQDGILIVDATSGRILDANPFLAKLLGYCREELTGKELWEIGLFEDIEANKAAFRTLQDVGYIRYENRPLLTEDGRKIEVEFVSNTYDDGGALFIQCNIRDITDRTLAEEALSASEQRLQDVIASSPAVLFTVAFFTEEGRRNEFQRLSWISDNIQAMLGFTPEDAFAPEWWQGNIHPDFREDVVAKSYEEFFRQGFSIQEYRFRHADGQYRWIRSEGRLIRDADGVPVEVVGAWSDITDRKLLEEQYHQAQKMEAFGQLAGGVAHDFNNLLTIINGYSELLLTKLLPQDPSRDMITQILEAGERSAGLTRQLLAFSRQQILATRILDLNEVVNDTGKMLHRLIGEDIKLTTTLQPELWAVRADPGQIEQVLMNLAVNARDAMPKGGRLTIETQNVELDEAYVRIHVQAHAGEHVLLTITDTGCGIREDVRAKIFEPFFTTKEVGKGTGLGLATVHGIIQQSGGHVLVSSKVGVGTTFQVYLPRTEQMAEKAISPSALRVPARGTETILLAEDEVGLRTLTHTILVSCGYKVLDAADGNEAVRAAARHHGPIHLLITDVVMPGLSGRAVAEKLAEPRREMRVLFMSGYTDDAVIRHGVLRNGVNFLQKPFSPFGLAAKVREVLDAPYETSTS